MNVAKSTFTPLPELSVVIPVYNERDNILPLLDEVLLALRNFCTFEIVCVDDASTDGTAERLAEARSRIPELVLVVHDQNQGQSVALGTGVLAARASWVATLDGDGQNDPADLPRLIAERHRQHDDVKLIAGWRVTRRDSLGKRFGSRLANAVRSRLLHDATPDTGCGTKLFERAAYMALPRFNHMHRYLPALFQRDGWRSVSLPVNHRPRVTGVSKYNNLQRLRVGLLDLVGVSWLIRRHARVYSIKTRLFPQLPAAAGADAQQLRA